MTGSGEYKELRFFCEILYVSPAGKLGQLVRSDDYGEVRIRHVALQRSQGVQSEVRATCLNFDVGGF